MSAEWRASQRVTIRYSSRRNSRRWHSTSFSSTSRERGCPQGEARRAMRPTHFPTLVYCQSPPRATSLAEYLLEHGDLGKAASTRAAVEWLRREYPEEWILTKALEHGIGIHHGNVPRAIQQYIIRAFDSGEIKIIICTTTLIEGINTVAENVIIYDRRVENTGFDAFTFRNIAGRAGRMRKYFIGKVFVLEAAPPDETMSVEIGVGLQNENTPAALLLELDDEDLAPISRQRVLDIERESPFRWRPFD
ncbi:hypothetical protein GL174_10650 [Sphingobium sp. CAP-1]|nr:hypothetical protein GL174_10650 [Sphingobium sp. CAP-1]